MFTDEKVAKINEMNLTPDTEVTLTYSECTDCSLRNEDEIEQGLQELSVVSTFADMVSQRGMNFTDVYGNNVIEELVENEVLDREVLEEKLSELDELEEDEEPWETLGEVIAEAINDNFYDQNVVESDVTRFDIKRGEIKLSTTLVTTVGEVLENNPLLSGWEVTVPFLGGTFTLQEGFSVMNNKMSKTRKFFEGVESIIAESIEKLVREKKKEPKKKTKRPIDF